QSEFKALNYQINPHFIFNVLNSIQYYILRKDSDKAVHFLSSFSTLIRRIVSNSRQQYISVIEEVECLKDYLDLEKLRLENKFDYELNIDSNVDIEQKTMLPMIIQPLVENSIWHGIVPLEERGKIKVDFKLDEVGALVCTVDDNGVGINSTKLITKKEQNNLSLAMSNVKERLKIIGELNGSEWFINFKDKSELGNKDRGTIVTIRFPLAKKD
ncbi:MAG: histidine kinase, partial [Bacteroidetes bacterium]|nr:histidine kinase [Bacteroidota bacterium]